LAGETGLLNRYFSSNEPVEQGSREIVLASSDKIPGFKRKLSLWKNNVLKGNLEIFPLPLGLEFEEVYKQGSSLIENHLEELRNNIKQVDSIGF
jgi:hypothetical protein